jgi:hypothetical protein
MHELAVLPHLTIPTYLLDRRTKCHSQANHPVRQHQTFHFYNNTKIGHLRNNSTTFIKRLNFLCFLNLVLYYVSFYFPILLNLPSLFSHPYSYSLNFPPSPVLQAIVLPPNYWLFLFLSTLSPIFTSPSYLPSPCHHSIPPSYKLTTCWLEYWTNCI